MSLHDDALCPKKGGMVRQWGRLGNRPIFLFRVKLTETAEKTDEPCGMLHHYAVDCCKSPLKKNSCTERGCRGKGNAHGAFEALTNHSTDARG